MLSREQIECLTTSMPRYLPTCLPAYLPTYLPAYISIDLGTYTHSAWTIIPPVPAWSIMMTAHICTYSRLGGTLHSPTTPIRGETFTPVGIAGRQI